MGEQPWQVAMFQRSLKKKQKVKTLMRFLPDVTGKKCLDITCGDNTGAMNYYFRQKGGNWVSADLEAKNLNSMKQLLQTGVLQLHETKFCFPDNTFDYVVVIDVLEHIEDPRPFLQELHRITKPEGRLIVTVPNGDQRLLMNKVKRLIGMTPEKYGHVRAGFTLKDLGEIVERGGFSVVNGGGYSKVFTELVELAINASYVLVMNKNREENYGTIAPTTHSDLKTHGLSYKLYSVAYPVLRALASLDQLLFSGDYYAVVVEGIK
ncbi:MAG: methyltransferase domain-containing protein, partial [bacterium]